METFVGLDVHKKYTQVAVKDKDGNLLVERQLRNLPDELRGFAESLDDESHVVMETTENWYYLYEVLERHVASVTLAHPLKTRAIASARIKTDRIDASILSDLLRANLVPEAYIPDRETRDLREILRYRATLVAIRAKAKQYLHSILTKNGIELPYYDILGKRSRVFLQTIELRDCYRLKTDGFIQMAECLDRLIDEVTAVIDRLATMDSRAGLLDTIPGIGSYSALLILSEIGTIERFPSPRRLASYAGLVPSVYSSGGKTRYGRLTKLGSKWLRWILVECSYHVIEKSHRFQDFFRRVSYRHGRKTAHVAVARKLTRVIWCMLTRGEPFRDMPVPASSLGS